MTQMLLHADAATHLNDGDLGSWKHGAQRPLRLRVTEEQHQHVDAVSSEAARQSRTVTQTALQVAKREGVGGPSCSRGSMTY